MTSPAHDTALFLVAASVAGGFGAGSWSWPVFVGREPLVPDNVITAYDTGGGPAILYDLREPTVQVRVRANSYALGWEKANAAFSALVTPVTPATTDGVTLQWSATSDVLYLGRNDDDDPLFTCNFQLLRDGA